MAKPKKSSPSFISNSELAPGQTLSRTGRVRFLRSSCEDHFGLVEPQINAEGVHVWNFDVACPLDVLFLHESGQEKVRMNRHSYFEVLYLCSGSALFHIQDRLLPMRVGDLAVIGSTLYHRIERRSSSPLTIAAAFFDPEMIRCGGGNDGMEYLTPFLLQDASFPHIIPAETGIPRQVLEMMLRIHAERPAAPKSRLSVKTYLKLILAWLVSYYESYSGTVEVFHRQERALDRIRPLFRFLEENCGGCIQIKEAARICGMSESHFMSVFKEVTGLSFLKYLNHYRVERAQAMLTHSDDSMKNICQEVGFCDQSYFGAVFRKVVGLTPAEYRRRFKSNGIPEYPRVHQDSSVDQVREKQLQGASKEGIRHGSELRATGTAGPTLVGNRRSG
jgi:AraC-like DNA-binding protein/mannose-6-phosphate isomerase-like protein (cupin superfamily)